MLDVGGGRGNDGGGGVAEEREREKGVGTRWERGGNEVGTRWRKREIVIQVRGFSSDCLLPPF